MLIFKSIKNKIKPKKEKKRKRFLAESFESKERDSQSH